MVQQMGSAEEELVKTQEASTGKVADLQTELTNAKESQAWQELKNKDQQIDNLKMEVKRTTEMEAKLVDKEACLQKLNEELIKAKSSKALDSDSSKALEQTQISLEESKLEIKCLLQKLDIIDVSTEEKSNINSSKIACLERQLEGLKSSLETKEVDCAQAQENEQRLLSNEKGLLEEMNSLRSELKLATEAEEKSRKAMEDLAMALTEVAAEAKQTKEKLASTEQELENSKGELAKLKPKLKTVKEMYTELKKEADMYKNTAERLRLEEEETHLAWNAKEIGFVECIRKAEEERDEAIEAVRAFEEMLRKQKEENQKVRDILKQALNEANVAKEGAEIAREENSHLKDALAQKDKALNFLSQENEDLKINEAAAFDNIKELKRLLHEATMANDSKKSKPQKSIENDHKDDKEQGKKHKEEKEHKGGWRLSNTFSLKWQNRHKDADEEQKTPNKEGDVDDHKEHSVKLQPQEKHKLANKESDENGKHLSLKLVPQASPKPSPKASPKLTPKASPKLSPLSSPKLSPLSSPKLRQQSTVESEQKGDKEHTRKLKPQGSTAIEQKDDEYKDCDPLKGSIFDVAQTANSSPEFADFDGDTTNFEDLDQLEPTHSDDVENHERNSTRKKALLRRFGDLIGSRSFHQRKVESTLDQ